MNYALALETSGARGGIALGENDRILEVRNFESSGRHAVDLMPSIADVCARRGVSPAEISQVFVSQGPGSFTGLRLGVTVARMIGWANRARVVGVPTLEVVARNALDLDDPPHRVAVVLDARRRNVYAAAFTFNGLSYEPLDTAAEVNPEHYLCGQPEDCAVLGEGVRVHRAAIEATGRRILPDALHAARAEHVFQLGVKLASQGAFTEARDLTPAYVRLPEPEEKWARRQSD